MHLVTYLQGPYGPVMADPNDSPLTFQIPPSGMVRLMAQATALCDDSYSKNHTVGVLFKLYDQDGNPVAEQAAYAKGLNPGHSTVCMTYLHAQGLAGGQTARITIETASGTYGNGHIGEGDYYSIAVVELEQALLKEGGGGQEPPPPPPPMQRPDTKTAS